MLVVINAVLFQIGWFACVLGAAYQLPWLGSLMAVAIVAYHLSRTLQLAQELKLIALVVTAGFVWDSLQVTSGLLHYDSGLLHQSLAPYWIIAMWALFASTLNVSLKWMKGKYFIATLFGLVGGPLAFYGGYKLGAVTFSDTSIAMLALGVGWAFIMPLMMWLSHHYNGFTHQAEKLEVCDA